MAVVVQLDNISKYIGELILFEQVSFELSEGEKAALIGVNGAGKTSLLNIITGNDSPDTGKVLFSSDIKVAYLPQEPVLPGEATVMQALFQSDNQLVSYIMSYEEALLSEDIRLIEAASADMERLKLWDFETRIKQTLTHLKITDYHQKINELSGGQKKRVALANAILNEPDLLILDEPTNHLDLEVIEWLENYIQRARMSLIMVTHDRFFLDRVCNTILEIDQQKLYKYEGNYSRFVDQRQKRIELEQQEVDKAKNLLRKEEEWMRRMPKARGTKAKYRIDNYYQLKEVSSQKRNDTTMKLNVKESRMGSKILEAKELFFAWDNSYYIHDFSYIFSRYEKIGIIGKNGTGKSTLLQLLTRNLQPERGSIITGETIKFGYYRQEGISFNENMRVIDVVSEIAETVVVGNNNTITSSQFLTYFLFPHSRQNDYVYKLSGGEKRRLYLCTVLMQNPNFLILDEPTNDLDIASLQVLEEYLASFNGCVLVVSHDRYFMDSVVDHLFVFQEEGKIKDYPGNYSNYFNWRKEQEKELEQLERKKPEPSRSKPSGNANKLSYKEKRELESLENEIDNLENEKAEIEKALASGQLEASELDEKSVRLGIILQELDYKSDRWLELSEKSN